MWRAFGMCAGIAFTAACGLSNEYVGPTGGGIGANGPGGGNGVGSTGSSGGAVNGGQTGSTSGNGGNGVNGVNGVGTTNGFSGTSNGNGPGGNGPGGNGPGGTAAASTGGFMGTSGGTSGGGGTGGGGACATELQPCSQSDAGAACCGGQDLACTTEPAAGAMFCEIEGCSKESPCTNAQTVCEDGTCGLNICGGSSGNGSLNGSCSADGAAGTCLPEGTGMGEYGICYVAGTADGGCIVDATTTEPQDLCVAGQFCGYNPNGPGDVCHTICDPGKGSSKVCEAAGYTFCVPIGNLGVCLNF